MSSREDCINPTTDGKQSWKSVSSCKYDSGDALKNWQNKLHEVCMRRCARITRCVQKVGVEANKFPTYEGLTKLASFLVEFKEKVTESQRWWGTYKQSICECPQCKRLLDIRFGEEISYSDQKYT